MAGISHMPAKLLTAPVEPTWIDYNGHMNDASYAIVFSRSVDELMRAIGLDTHGRERTSRTLYTLTLTVHYHHEAKLGDTLAVTGRFLEYDKKRIRVWLEMTRTDGGVAATSEQILLCVDQSGDKPRVVAFSEPQLAAIASMSEATAHLPWPGAAGRGISLKRS